MRVISILAFLVFTFALFSAGSILSDSSTQEGKKLPETIVLSKEAKLGPVPFNHLKHVTEKRSPDGTKLIDCVECHHTAQPASEAVKHPPHKTVYPPDRTSTLTMELFEKDANAVGAVCRDCHARAGEKPKLLPEIPQVKFEGSDEPTSMTNQHAFQHKCGECHDKVVKARPDLNPPPPTSKKCMACHKKAAA